MADPEEIESLASEIYLSPKAEWPQMLRMVNRTFGVFKNTYHLRIFKNTIVYCKGPAPANEEEWILEDQPAPDHIEMEEARFSFEQDGKKRKLFKTFAPIESLARDIYNSPKAKWCHILFLVNCAFRISFGRDVHHLRVFAFANNTTFVLCKGMAPTNEEDSVLEEPAPDHVELEVRRFCFGPPLPAHDYDATFNEQGKGEKGTASEVTEKKKTLFQVKSGVSKKKKKKGKGKA